MSWWEGLDRAQFAAAIDARQKRMNAVKPRGLSGVGFWPTSDHPTKGRRPSNWEKQPQLQASRNTEWDET